MDTTETKTDGPRKFYVYFREEGINGVFAVSKPSRDSTEYTFGWSFCSEKDQFTRKKAKLIADGRLASPVSRQWVDLGTSKPSKNQMLRAFMDQLCILTKHRVVKVDGQSKVITYGALPRQVERAWAMSSVNNELQV